jgi:glycosyltransferase involved in cell wall biosynthesis
MRLAVIASHPIQYQAPLFRALSRQIELKVFFAHRATTADQSHAGFGVNFDWDLDLLSGYQYSFLRNVSKSPCLDRFMGCDTPDIGTCFAECRFDAVLLMGWNLKCFVQSLVAAKRLGIPVLARGDSHLETPRRAFKKVAKALTYPAFLRLFDAALYVGKRSRAYWRHYGYPAHRLFFSPHCVDSEWFARSATPETRIALRARLGLPPGARVALFAGKLVPIKRPLDLVASAARLRHERQEFAILVAGSGPLESEMAEMARLEGVTLHHLGFCNQSQMPAAYAAADILVLPSESETWGLVANEALACGRPVVLSDAVGAASDLAADGSAGRVFAVADVGALSAALSEVFDHPPAADAIAAKSATYSVGAAAAGIIRAAAFAAGNQCQSAA